MPCLMPRSWVTVIEESFGTGCFHCQHSKRLLGKETMVVHSLQDMISNLSNWAKQSCWILRKVVSAEKDEYKSVNEFVKIIERVTFHALILMAVFHKNQGLYFKLENGLRCV